MSFYHVNVVGSIEGAFTAADLGFPIALPHLIARMDLKRTGKSSVKSSSYRLSMHYNNNTQEILPGLRHVPDFLP